MSKIGQLKAYIKSQDGYKISNTHFKIGAKIHSNNFYYAKRLFQNSYYTSRIALLLAIKVKNEFLEKDAPLTLVGYEMYSELLLALTKKFLNDFGYSKIEHFITLDTEDKMRHQPHFKEINKNVIIIVPIASTGSTVKKIEQYVRKIKTKNENHTPRVLNFNILVAQDTDSSYEAPFLENPIITLKTTWRSPDACEWCLNNDLSLPLFETDKSSLVPSLIFGLPTSKSIRNYQITEANPDNAENDDLSTDISKVNFREALIYRKAKRNDEHFLFSTNTDILIEKNKTAIEAWLNKLSEKISSKQTDKIVIISPCHYSNTKFINLVNDYLFYSSATIIHYQTDTDYFANFKILNKKSFEEKDVKIFFVDDSLISGKSFFNIYDLLRYTTDYKKPLSGAIFLSNKSSPDIHTRVNRASKIYSFVNVNLPISPKILDQKPLEHESKRYAELSKSVLHDVFKSYFRSKAEDLSGLDTALESFKPDGQEKDKRHEKMFKATHMAYEFFDGKTELDELTFEELLTKCKFEPKDIEDKMGMMKVLSQYPFLLYMPVRKKTFEWLKIWFNKVTADLHEHFEKTPDKPVQYDQFRELKFLVRRSVFLGYHSICSSDFLQLIAVIFDKINSVAGIIQRDEIPGEIFDRVTRERPMNDFETRNLNDFHIFLMVQYLELIQKNGWTAAKLTENLRLIEDDFKTGQAKQFLRMLRMETGSVLTDFYSLINENEQWLRLYELDHDYQKIMTDLDKIEGFFDQFKEYHKSKKFQLSNETLLLTANDLSRANYITYLWIKNFLGLDLNSSSAQIDLTLSTEAIFGKLTSLFHQDEQVGAFFIVTDGRNRPHLVFDKDFYNNRLLKELDEIEHQIIFSFLSGENDPYDFGTKSLKELEKKSGNEWIDLHSLTGEDIAGTASLSQANSLLIIRIADQNSKTLGLMGFYSPKKLKWNLLAKQLLMLLREDIGKFVIKHHKNDEFSFLREAEMTKRFAYLAGHGRQMMQKLANHEGQLFYEVVETMERLQYLFATKLISPTGYTDILKHNTDKNLFNGIFLNNEVDIKDLTEIRMLGTKIYHSHLIDNFTKFDELGLKTEDEDFKPAPIPSDFGFKFNKSILKFICFELFVNAKKNRFHFVGNRCNTCNTDFNSLAANFEIVDDKLIVTIAGTGPALSSWVKGKINDGDYVKPKDEIAGIQLITKVISFLNTENRLNIESLPYKSCCGIYKNTVRLTLRPRNGS